MRGYRERMWTLHYTVFMSGKKYVIYIEYFLLPATPIDWRRGPKMLTCLGFSPKHRLGSEATSVCLKFVPIERVSRIVRRVAKRSSNVAAEGAIWLWAHRASMARAVLGLASLPNITPRTAVDATKSDFFNWMPTNVVTSLTTKTWSGIKPRKRRSGRESYLAWKNTVKSDKGMTRFFRTQTRR